MLLKLEHSHLYEGSRTHTDKEPFRIPEFLATRGSERTPPTSIVWHVFCYDFNTISTCVRKNKLCGMIFTAT